MQELALFPVKYPAVLGIDLAGEIVEVGTSVSRFAKGDRVIGHALIVASDRANKECESAFQAYTVVLDRMACRIPSTMSFE